jgi:hypothetical protein
MTDNVASILPDGIAPPTMDTIRLLRAYLVADHARAAEIIKSLDPAASDRVCAELVDIYVPMAARAARDGLGWSTDEIQKALPRAVARMSGNEFTLTTEQIYEVCAAWFAGQPDRVTELTRGDPTRELWLHAAASYTMTVGVKAFGPKVFGAYLTLLRKLRDQEPGAGHS